jgi:multisubunit Na+/H+ antiporter MnhC subunit
LAGRISNDRSNGVTDCANIHRYPIRFERVSDGDVVAKHLRATVNRPVGQTLLLGAVVIGTTMLAAVILYAVTGWLWLVVHEGLH